MVNSSHHSIPTELRTGLLAFGGALVTLVVFVIIVGTDDIVAALASADLTVIAGVFVAAGGSLLIWGLGLYVVFRALGQFVAPWRTVALFVATVFLNNVTPFGQAGGDPVSGIVAAWVADTNYEQGFAAIVSVNTLNTVVSVCLGVASLWYVVTGITSKRLLPIITSIMFVLFTFGWYYRTRLATAIVPILVPPARLVGSLVPWFSKPDRVDIAERVNRFVESLERLAGDPRRLIVVVVFSLLGQLCVAVCLWLSLFSLGVVIPIALILVIIPLARIAAIAPTPGGLGAVEIAIVGLLVVTTGMAVSVASAATLVYRTIAFWIPTIVGGGVTAAIVKHRQ